MKPKAEGVTVEGGKGGASLKFLGPRAGAAVRCLRESVCARSATRSRSRKSDSLRHAGAKFTRRPLASMGRFLFANRTQCPLLALALCESSHTHGTLFFFFLQTVCVCMYFFHLGLALCFVALIKGTKTT